VNAAIAHARNAFPAGPDVIIGIGGGSNLDVSKVTGVVLAHGGTPFDYFGEYKVPGPIAPVIAVPTTSGTGSEVTPIAVIEDTTKHLKLAVTSNHIMPRIALVDPLLTLSCPARVTAESGMDALTHALECYTILDYHAMPVDDNFPLSFAGKTPLTETLAAKAIQLIGANLRNAVYQPHNADAREGMSLGALIAGLAFCNSGLGSVHALQYPLGAITHTSHGVGNAVLLPATVEYLLPTNYARFAEVAGWLGADTRGMSQQDAAMQCVTAIRKLSADVGIPSGIGAMGITDSDIPGMAQTGMTYQRLGRCSARPLSEQALQWILRKAM
jgi:alcohol dehydrogenase class IV